MKRLLVLAATVPALLLQTPERLPRGGVPVPRTGPRAADPSWVAAAKRRIARSEYEAAWQPAVGALQAPNRAHDLRTTFTKSGIRTVSRKAEVGGPSWEWTLRYRGVTTDGGRAPADPAEPRARGERVEVAHERGVVEWFVNDERGLEHGFTLEAPIARESVSIHLELGGSLTPVLAAGGVDLLDRSGVRVLRYDGLVSRDAAGRELPSRMTLVAAAPERRELALVVDARRATYPVTIDPLATSPSATLPNPQTNSGFGKTVTTAGDVDGDGYSEVLVTAPDFDDGHPSSGKVFVYAGSANGVSTTPMWTAQANRIDARFGQSAGTAGDVNGDGYADVVVGAPGDDVAVSHGGAVFVWYGSVTGLGPNGDPGNADFSRVGADSGGALGERVVTLGDVDGDGRSEIAVQSVTGVTVYRGSASGLSTTGAIPLSFPRSPLTISGGDFNGDGLADLLVAVHVDCCTADDEARIYFGPDFTSSPFWHVLGSEAEAVGDVDGDGKVDLLVENIISGRTSLYLGGSPSPSTTAAWGTDLRASPGTGVGDVNGDGYADLLFGNAGFDNQTGRVLGFLGSADFAKRPDGTADNADWIVPSPFSCCQAFGTSLGPAGDVNGDGFSDVLVATSDSSFNVSKVVVLLGGAVLPDVAHSFQLNGSGDFGTSVAFAGDVNADGYGDLIVGAPLYDGGQTDEGRAFVFYGGPDGPSPTADWFAQIDTGLAHFGSSVAGAGDVNGDGYDDVIIGAEDYTGGGNANQGAAFVWYGGLSGLGSNGVLANAGWKAFGVNLSAHLGTSVAGAGDVNGDGFADVIVGAPNYGHGQSVEGIALVFHGSASGLGADGSFANADAVLEANVASAHFGTSVASAGDVNADGFSDVIVGAPDYDVTAFGHEGAAFVFKGSPKGLATAPVWATFGATADSDYGRAVSTAGDVNGDGFSDVVVGAPRGETATGVVGRIHVYRGNAGGVSTTPTSRSGAVVGGEFGSAVAAADIDGDGFSDVIVGAPKRTGTQTEEGAVFVYLGGSSIGSTAAFSYRPVIAFEHLGTSVAAGDLNGDGFPEVIAGAPGGDEVRVFYGNRGPARERRPRQRRFADTTPIARLGISNVTNAFATRLTLSSPFGRLAWLQMETEAKPLGVAFDGLGTQKGSKTAALQVSSIVSATGLASGTPYHWRARTLFDPVTSPLQGHGPWFTIPSTSFTEAVVRTRRACVSSGDANASGAADVSDVFYLINALFAGGPPPSRGCGDVNGDAALNVQDIFYLINFLFAGGPAPV